MDEKATAGSYEPQSLRGLALLRDPLLNKGTAFTEIERDRFGLRGLLPGHILTMEMQADRILENLPESSQQSAKVRRSHRASRP